MSVTLDARNFVEGEVWVYWGIAAGDATPAAMPALTEDVGVTHTGWSCFGFTTEDGVAQAGLTPDSTPVNTAQQRNSAATFTGQAAQTVTFTLLESTLANIRVAAGLPVSALVSVAPGASTRGSDTLTFKSVPPKRVALLVEGYGKNSMPMRGFYPMGTLRITGDLVRRIGQPMGVPCTFTREGGDQGNPVWTQVIPQTGP